MTGKVLYTMYCTFLEAECDPWQYLDERDQLAWDKLALWIKENA